jgi:hypothetical protein
MFDRLNPIIIGILFLIGTASLIAADVSKEEEREINAYRLTRPKMAQFGKATKNLIAAIEKNPKLFDQPSGTKKQNRIEDLVNLTNQIPEAKQAIEAGGMTAKEYWTFQMAMVYASTGDIVLKSGGQLPAGYSRENVEFYRANETEFIKLGEDLKTLQERTGDQTNEEGIYELNDEE